MRELTAFEKKITGPLDAGLLVATLAYGAGFYGLKWLHEKLQANLLIAETEWMQTLNLAGCDTWSEEDWL
jgi:hypothetical protein